MTDGRKTRIFSEEEKAAIREYTRERRAAHRRPVGEGTDGTADVLAAIARMEPADRSMAERLHAVITAAGPTLVPRTWYGSPAYSRDGKVVCFFQERSKFKVRYITLGFSDAARLDDGAMWPTSYAVNEMTAGVEERIADLVRRAVG
jgi:hypothetical protein